MICIDIRYLIKSCFNLVVSNKLRRLIKLIEMKFKN